MKAQNEPVSEVVDLICPDCNAYLGAAGEGSTKPHCGKCGTIFDNPEGNDE